MSLEHRGVKYRVFFFSALIFLAASCSCGSSDDDSSSDDAAPLDDSLDDDTDDDTSASDDAADDTNADDTDIDDTTADDSADDSGDDTEPTTTTTTTTHPTTTTHGTTTTTTSSTTTTVPSTTTTTTTTLCLDDTAVAMFVEPTTAAVGESISFTAVPGQYGTGVEWDLGDGGTSTNWEFLHAYDVAGDYEVRVTVAGSESDPHSCDEEQTFTVHIEDAADDTADDDLDDDTADDDAATPLDSEITFVGGGDAIPGKVVVDGSGMTYFFLGRSRLVTYYTSSDGVNWDYHFLAGGMQPRAGAGTDGIVRVAYVDPAGTGSVIYSDNSTGSFVAQTINTDGHVISKDYFDMAVGTDGRTHVVYNDLTLDRLRYATDASGSWTIETIPVPLSSVGRFSIAVDDDGWIHLVCFINSRLTHITNRDGDWATFTVNPVTAGYYPNIAVGADGYVHITYGYSYGDMKIRYSTDWGGSWSTRVLCDADASYDWGCFPESDVEVDSLGQVIVLLSYYQTWSPMPPNYDAFLLLVNFPAGSTSSTAETLATDDGNMSDYFKYSLSATANREIHAGYLVLDTAPFELYHKKSGTAAEKVEDLYYGAAGDACYARGSDGSNHFSYIGTRGFYHASELSGGYSADYLGVASQYIQWGIGLHTSTGSGGDSHIVVDDSGVANIVYGWYSAASDMGTVSMDSEIRRTRIDGASITTSALVSSIYYCTYCSETTPEAGFTVDPSYDPYVSFFFQDMGGLRYNDPSHYSDLIDSSGGYNPAIALDSAGKAHIVYYSYSNYSLKYATNFSGAWETKYVVDDVFNGGGTRASIAVDPDNGLHVLFADRLDDAKVYYAENTTGAWNIELIADNAKCHRGGIAVDSAGTVHIAYYDETNGEILYAYNDGSGWNRFIVDEGSGQAGIAVDEDEGTVRVGYVSWDGLWAAEFPIP